MPVELADGETRNAHWRPFWLEVRCDHCFIPEVLREHFAIGPRGKNHLLKGKKGENAGREARDRL
jgi:hypothetical protein